MANAVAVAAKALNHAGRSLYTWHVVKNIRDTASVCR